MTNTITGPGTFSRPMEWRPMEPDHEKIFEKHDANGDGSLDEAEFGTFIDTVAEKTGSTIDAETAFATVDTGNDGLVDLNEFIEGGKKLRENMGPGRPPMKGMKPDSELSSMMDMLQLLEETGEEDTELFSTDITSLTRQLLLSYNGNQDSQTDVTDFYDVLA